MANMKVVKREWDGTCVVACDCGSEEPVENTMIANDMKILEDEIKKLRSQNNILRKRCHYFKRLGSLTAEEMREEWEDLSGLLMEYTDENKKLKSDLRRTKLLRGLSFNQRTDMEINEKLFPEPLDDRQQGIDKNISELKKVTEYLSAIHRKELDLIEAHEAMHRQFAEEHRRKHEANSEGEPSE